MIANPLTEWVIDNLNRGCSEASIYVQALKDGFDQKVIDEAVAAAKRDNPPSALPLVVDDGTGFWRTSDAGGRLLLSQTSTPHIQVLADFVADYEIKQILEHAVPMLTRSTALNAQTGRAEVHEARTSDSAFFSRGEHPIIKLIEDRIEEVTSWPTSMSEGLQVLRYRNGAQYIPHFDFFDPSYAGNQKIISRGGNRVGTMLIYLQSPERGGATVFNDLGVSVPAHAGTALLFTYDSPSFKTMSLHSGAPVQTGEKIVMTKWFRQREYN